MFIFVIFLIPYISDIILHLAFSFLLCMIISRSIHVAISGIISFFLWLSSIPLCIWVYMLLFFSHQVVSNSSWPHRLQHTRPPCPSPSPRVCPNSCPLHQWCHPAISSSVIPFCSHLQYFPSSGSFPMSQLFRSGGQSIGDSASASVLPKSIQGWFPLGFTGLISLLSKGLSSKSLLQHNSYLFIITSRNM